MRSGCRRTTLSPRRIRDLLLGSDAEKWREFRSNETRVMIITPGGGVLEITNDTPVIVTRKAYDIKHLPERVRAGR